MQFSSYVFVKLWVEIYFISENSTEVIGILCRSVAVKSQISEVLIFLMSSLINENIIGNYVFFPHGVCVIHL